MKNEEIEMIFVRRGQWFIKKKLFYAQWGIVQKERYEPGEEDIQIGE